MRRLPSILCWAVVLAALLTVPWLSTGGLQMQSAEGDDVVRAASELRIVPTGETYDKQTIDPVEANGPIFVDWPKPQAALLFSGEMNGYLEPCGCTGLENQKGGLKRRHTLIKQLEGRGWPLAKFDMGGLTRRLGRQAEIKYQYAFQSLTKLGYAAIGMGAHELQLPAEWLVFTLANLESANRATSANVGLFGFGNGLVARYRVVKAGRRRIAVTSVLGRVHHAALKSSTDIELKDPVAALAEVSPKMIAERCDLQVLLVHGTPEEASELARKFPQFQLVGTTGGAEEPPNRLQKIPGSDAQLIEVGHKGTYAVVIGIYDDPRTPFRFQRVPLDHRFEDSAEMHQMMIDYQNELQLVGLEGLGLRPNAHPEGEFAGSEACADCHSEATEVFENSHHPHATESLITISDPPRQHDPECLSCHATGWNPQEYFPYATGFTGVQSTPHLVGNGCENCHGPAAAHVAVENGEKEVTEAEQEALREALRLRIVNNEGNRGDLQQVYGKVVENCMLCHDVDNSPDFDFQKYWEAEVKHGGD